MDEIVRLKSSLKRHLASRVRSTGYLLYHNGVWDFGDGVLKPRWVLRVGLEELQ